jgi:hypothetical protein
MAKSMPPRPSQFNINNCNCLLTSIILTMVCIIRNTQESVHPPVGICVNVLYTRTSHIGLLSSKYNDVQFSCVFKKNITKLSLICDVGRDNSCVLFQP